MSLSDRYAETIYQMVKSQSRLKIILTPVGAIIWVGFCVPLVLVSLWLDRFMPVQLLMPKLITLSISVPLLLIGCFLLSLTVYSFFKARGSPVPINPPQRLVTTGLYSHIRNPMLLGWFILLFGLGVLLNSFSLICVFTPLFILCNVVYLKAVEEKEMAKKFGEQYLEYKKSVPMFIPLFRR